jgi:hypothetical protein
VDHAHWFDIPIRTKTFDLRDVFPSQGHSQVTSPSIAWEPHVKLFDYLGCLILTSSKSTTFFWVTSMKAPKQCSTARQWDRVPSNERVAFAGMLPAHRAHDIGCPAPSVVFFPLCEIMSDNFTHCIGWWQWISHYPS